ncbi:MAG TPA: NUDIX domain-containing protein [Dissulfurispiraceae bacterium]|nr:NUDIX domain-containing protein [Dissulfurispiraceae bacterium]
MPDEIFEIVDADGNVLGLRSRAEVHQDPSLLHKVAHVLVFNESGELLLQRRSMNKDVEPGKWDTSVGGHVSPGEDIKAAAFREMEEELGISCNDMDFLYSYIFSGRHESELVFSYRCTHNGPFTYNVEEIDAVAFWRLDDILNTLGCGTLSLNFEAEIRKYLSVRP